jgi:integrase
LQKWVWTQESAVAWARVRWTALSHNFNSIFSNVLSYRSKTSLGSQKKHLKRIGKVLEIRIKLIFHTACHYFTTKLKNSGQASLTFILESLGHPSSKSTKDYLAGFEDESSKKNHEVLMEGVGVSPF